MAGGSETDAAAVRSRFVNTPVYGSKQELPGNAAEGDEGRVGDTIFSYDGDDGWMTYRSFPEGTFPAASAAAGATPAAAHVVPPTAPRGLLQSGPFLVPDAFGAGDVAQVQSGLLAPGMTQEMYSPWSAAHWQQNLPNSANLAAYSYPNIPYPSQLGYMGRPPGGVAWSPAQQAAVVAASGVGGVGGAGAGSSGVQTIVHPPGEGLPGGDYDPMMDTTREGYVAPDMTWSPAASVPPSGLRDVPSPEAHAASTFAAAAGAAGRAAAAATKARAIAPTPSSVVDKWGDVDMSFSGLEGAVEASMAGEMGGSFGDFGGDGNGGDSGGGDSGGGDAGGEGEGESGGSG